MACLKTIILKLIESPYPQVVTPGLINLSIIIWNSGSYNMYFVSSRNGNVFRVSIEFRWRVSNYTNLDFDIEKLQIVHWKLNNRYSFQTPNSPLYKSNSIFWISNSVLIYTIQSLHIKFNPSQIKINLLQIKCNHRKCSIKTIVIIINKILYILQFDFGKLVIFTYIIIFFLKSIKKGNMDLYLKFLLYFSWKYYIKKL